MGTHRPTQPSHLHSANPSQPPVNGLVSKYGMPQKGIPQRWTINFDLGKSRHPSWMDSAFLKAYRERMLKIYQQHNPHKMSSGRRIGPGLRVSLCVCVAWRFNTSLGLV